MSTTIGTPERDRPAFGAMFSIEDVKRANRDAGFHFFDADTLRFFGSRVLSPVIAGRFFVTTERSGFDYSSPRRASLREFMPDGSVGTVGEFGEFTTPAQARAAARRAAKATRRFYFDGQHGKGGRRVVYVVTAPDAWAAMDRLHKNFRVMHCGHAADYMTGPNHGDLVTYRLVTLACVLYAGLTVALAVDAVVFLRPMLAA